MRAHARWPRSFGNVKGSVESAARAKSVFKSDLTALKRSVREKPEPLHCVKTKEFVLR